MNRRLFRLCAVALAFAPLHASAAGLGEIILQSRVGESLRAEIPVTSAAGEAIDTAGTLAKCGYAGHHQRQNQIGARWARAALGDYQ